MEHVSFGGRSDCNTHAISPPDLLRVASSILFCSMGWETVEGSVAFGVGPISQELRISHLPPMSAEPTRLLPYRNPDDQGEGVCGKRRREC